MTPIASRVAAALRRLAERVDRKVLDISRYTFSDETMTSTPCKVSTGLWCRVTVPGGTRNSVLAPSGRAPASGAGREEVDDALGEVLDDEAFLVLAEPLDAHSVDRGGPAAPGLRGPVPRAGNEAERVGGRGVEPVNEPGRGPLDHTDQGRAHAVIAHRMAEGRGRRGQRGEVDLGQTQQAPLAHDPQIGD